MGGQYQHRCPVPSLNLRKPESKPSAEFGTKLSTYSRTSWPDDQTDGSVRSNNLHCCPRDSRSYPSSCPTDAKTREESAVGVSPATATRQQLDPMYSLRLTSSCNWTLLSELRSPQSQLVSSAVISHNPEVFERTQKCPVVCVRRSSACLAKGTPSLVFRVNRLFTTRTSRLLGHLMKLANPTTRASCG